MAQTLLQELSRLSHLAGNNQLLADACLSSTNLAAAFGVGGAAAITDHGSNTFTAGLFRVRFKSPGGFSTANGQISLVVSNTSIFTSRQLVATFNPISAAAGVAAPAVQNWVGWFDTDPTPFRYTRLENAGVVIGGTSVTFDMEVLAF
jgi:hypothetical protein